MTDSEIRGVLEQQLNLLLEYSEDVVRDVLDEGRDLGPVTTAMCDLAEILRGDWGRRESV